MGAIVYFIANGKTMFYLSYNDWVLKVNGQILPQMCIFFKEDSKVQYNDSPVQRLLHEKP